MKEPGRIYKAIGDFLYPLGFDALTEWFYARARAKGNPMEWKPKT